MLTVFRLLSLRYLRQRWTRSALIVVSIALGVATLVSTRVLNRCIETAAAETTTPLGLGDLFVTNGELNVDRGLADEIRAANIPGVKSVQPLTIERMSVPPYAKQPPTDPPRENRGAVLLGVELASHQLSGNDPFATLDGGNAYKVKATRVKHSTATLFTALNRRVIALSRALFDEWEQWRDDESSPFVVQSGGRRIDCLPLWVIDYDADSPLMGIGPNVVGMEIGQAAEFLQPQSPPPDPKAFAAAVGWLAHKDVWAAGNPLRVNRVDIMVDPGTDADTVKTAVAAVVGERAVVNTPDDQGKSTREIVGGIQIGFTMCALGAMVVGLFLVYNALAVTVAERRHDIGTLRSLGCTRPQVVAIFLLAAGVLGLVGAAVGIPLGVGLSRLALWLIRDDLGTIFLNPSADPSWPTAATLLLAVAGGLVTALVAAVIPALQAASQNPADAVRRVPGGVGGGWRVAHRAVCATLVAGGVAMILSRHDLPPRVGAFGGLVSALVGLLLAAPIAVALIVRILQPILRRTLPIEARLASDNLIRSPGRTGLVIGALAAGVAVMIQTAGVGKSNEEPVTQWLDEIIQADQFVAGGSVTEAISSQMSAAVDPEKMRRLKAVPGVEHVAGIRYMRRDYNGTVIFMTALDVDQFVDPSQARGPNGLPQLDKFRPLAGTDGVVMSENFATRHGVRVGDVLTLPGPHRPVKVTVLDTIVDYSWSKGTLFIDRGVYARLFADSRIDICHVFVTQMSVEETAAARARVSQFAADNGYFAADRTALRQTFGDLIDRMYLLVHLQQFVVGMVAALGVVTSLLISVLQRKRELGLLLAVGATPAQIVKTVLYEAVLMGLLGTVLGFLIGVPLEWYVLKVVLFEESGFSFDLLLPWKHVIGIAVGGVGIATVAGLLPALRAVKTRIPDAIAYE
jgi:putative ABC transport system permease protein